MAVRAGTYHNENMSRDGRSMVRSATSIKIHQVAEMPREHQMGACSFDWRHVYTSMALAEVSMANMSVLNREWRGVRVRALPPPGP